MENLHVANNQMKVDFLDQLENNKNGKYKNIHLYLRCLFSIFIFINKIVLFQRIKYKFQNWNKN